MRYWLLVEYRIDLLTVVVVTKNSFILIKSQQSEPICGGDNVN